MLEQVVNTIVKGSYAKMPVESQINRMISWIVMISIWRRRSEHSMKYTNP